MTLISASRFSLIGRRDISAKLWLYKLQVSSNKLLSFMRKVLRRTPTMPSVNNSSSKLKLNSHSE